MNYVTMLYCILTGTAPAAMNPTPVIPPVVTPPAIERTVAAHPLTCEIHRAIRDGRPVITAVVHAKVQTKGEFEFALDTKDAQRNTVSASDGDRFSLHAGESMILRGPDISLGQGGTLVGHLEMRDTQGNTLTSCQL